MQNGFNVRIAFQSASIMHEYTNVKDVYTKDGLLCLSFTDTKSIFKFPLVNIFMIESDYTPLNRT